MRLLQGLLIAVALLFGVASGVAAPVTPQIMDTSAASIVENVHGCHRSCAASPRLGWHRHVGPYCEPVSCERHIDRFRGPVCDVECFGVGPARVCKRRCW